MTEATRTFWTLDALAEAAGGTWLALPPEPNQRIEGISIDTRTLQPGQVFVAIRGERFDGHQFVTQALEAGAGMAIVDRDAAIDPQSPGPVLRVDDTVAALQKLARAWRQVLLAAGTRVIAITGSNGKTTTRHLIHTVLSAKLAGTQSPKSFNNHLGVPLTLLAASSSDDFVVCEVGTNHPGEIAALADIAQPDVAAITNIGTAHIGNFGTREAIAREKSQLVQHVQPGGLVVVPCDEDWPDIVIPLPSDTAVVKFGTHQNADLRLHAIDADADAVRFSLNERLTLSLPLTGAHHAGNAAIAVAVARWMGLKDETITEALSHATPVAMRTQVQRIPAGADRPGIVLINDAYNANPNSMLAALATLQLHQPASGGRRVAILGDMFELGDDGPAEHRLLGTNLAGLSEGSTPIHAVVCVGKLMAFCAEALLRTWKPERVHPCQTLDDQAMRETVAMLQPGDVVLLKASRGMALERLIPHLEARFG